MNNNQQLIEFLDKYGLKGSWSGGNDSGGIDSLTTENTPTDISELEKTSRYLEQIQDLIYYEVFEEEYGSWAWNFDASGTISYNKETKTIRISGVHHDYEDTITETTIRLDPKDHFSEADLKRLDSINVFVSDYSDDAAVRVNIINGPYTESLEEGGEKLVNKIVELLEPYSDNGEFLYYVDEAFEIGRLIAIPVQRAKTENKLWELKIAEEEVSYESD